MKAIATKKLLLWVQLVCWIILMISGWQYLDRAGELEALELEVVEKDHFGGNDWVVWRDSPQGPVAVDVHPLKANRDEDYILPGDILKSIDYQPVYNAESVDLLIRRSPPGKVFIFQLERQDPLSFSPQQVNLFLVNSFQPSFTFTEEPLYWSVFIWIAGTGTFIAIVVLLIIYPLLRSKLLRNLPVLLTLIFALIAFGTQFIHHIFLLLNNEFELPAAEKFFTFILFPVIGFYGIAYYHSRVSLTFRWLSLLPVVILGIIIWQAWQQIYLSQQFWIYSGLSTSFILYFFMLICGFAILHTLIDKWKEMSLAEKGFQFLSLLIIAAVSLAYMAKITGWHIPIPEAGETSLLFAQLLLFVPMVNAASVQLKFGKVSVVVTRTILYILYFAATIFLYFLIHELLIYFNLQFRYQNLIEIIVLLVLVLFIRTMYIMNERRLSKYFVLTQQKKLETLNEFIARIPQFTSSKKLLESLEQHLGEYLETDQVTVWMEQDEVPEMLMNLGEDDLQAIHKGIDDARTWWSRNKDFSPLTLSADFETKLIRNQIHLVYVLRAQENKGGLLFLGRNKRGVYNLSDIEIIQRMVIQTRLTLDVLYLLEREKLLIQKTYEANLTALRSQINPHFLFNTLNTITALIHDAPDEAEGAIEKLAFIFRYTLKTSTENLVELHKELSLVSTYLEIEQLRFGDRLQVDYDLDPKANEIRIPAIVLQTLVENCIKHGIAKIIGKGIIRIQTRIVDDFLVIEVEDNGPGIDKSKIFTSTGLSNITTRMEEIYQMKNLLYFENTGNGTLVRVKIPINHE